MITDDQLRSTFVSPEMSCYFGRKLAEVPRQEVDARLVEALKFLNIAAYHPGVSIPVSQEIDEIWHLWILETQEYERLCGLLQGRKFLHHRSDTYAQCTNGRIRVSINSLEDDVGILADYVRNYGPFSIDRIRYWLLATYLVNRCGITVDQMNDWLESGSRVNHLQRDLAQ